ncbi:MAG TPA: hypothetical protein VN441_10860 [Syntrophomonas sp.]|nr:hypothetical protein [Syntrophomonas sp.]
MELWLAVLLFIVFAGFFSVLLFFSSRKQKTRFIIGSCILGAVLLALVLYIALTFLFLEGISSATMLSTALAAM